MKNIDFDPYYPNEINQSSLSSLSPQIDKVWFAQVRKLFIDQSQIQS